MTDKPSVHDRILEILDAYAGGHSAAADEIEMLFSGSALSRQWVPVSERLPPHGMRCLVSVHYGDDRIADTVTMVSYNNVDHPHNMDRPWGIRYGTVTHWRPLPAPPGEKAEE